MSWSSDYVGLPFVDGGRDRRGLDCWGLVRLVYEENLGIKLPLYGEISASELRRVSRAITAGQDAPTWRAVRDPQVFDVVVMLGGASFRPCHVGVMIDERRLLHVENDCDACIQNVSDLMIAPRIAGYRRYIGGEA